MLMALQHSLRTFIIRKNCAMRTLSKSYVANRQTRFLMRLP